MAPVNIIQFKWNFRLLLQLTHPAGWQIEAAEENNALQSLYFRYFGRYFSRPQDIIPSAETWEMVISVLFKDSKEVKTTTAKGMKFWKCVKGFTEEEMLAISYHGGEYFKMNNNLGRSPGYFYSGPASGNHTMTREVKEEPHCSGRRDRRSVKEEDRSKDRKKEEKADLDRNKIIYEYGHRHGSTKTELQKKKDLERSSKYSREKDSVFRRHSRHGSKVTPPPRDPRGGCLDDSKLLDISQKVRDEYPHSSGTEPRKDKYKELWYIARTNRSRSRSPSKRRQSP